MQALEVYWCSQKKIADIMKETKFSAKQSPSKTVHGLFIDQILQFWFPNLVKCRMDKRKVKITTKGVEQLPQNE